MHVVQERVQHSLQPPSSCQAGCVAHLISSCSNFCLTNHFLQSSFVRLILLSVTEQNRSRPCRPGKTIFSSHIKYGAYVPPGSVVDPVGSEPFWSYPTIKSHKTRNKCN